MIVDAHAHIWKADRKYPDPSVTIMSPLCDVPLSLFKQYLDEHGVERAVLVQPMYPGEDNSLVADAARAEPDRFAAVVVVDPRTPNAPDRLTFWVKEQGCRGLRLRPSFPGEAEVFEREPLWQRSRELGIAVSVLARPEHLPAIGRMAARFPEVPVIVDHLAHPDGPAALQALLDLAPLPNVRVKPTGFYYYSKTGYPYDDSAGFFKAVYERFGPDRMIWGSDFPHVLLKAGYARTLKLFERRFTYVSPDERGRIMGRNALALYWRSR